MRRPISSVGNGYMMAERAVLAAVAWGWRLLGKVLGNVVAVAVIGAVVAPVLFTLLPSTPAVVVTAVVSTLSVFSK